MVQARGMRRWPAVALVLVTLGMPSAAFADDCSGDGEVTVLISPRTPVAGGRLRVLAASDAGPLDEVVVSDGEGRATSATITRLGGPPWAIAATIAPASAGLQRVEVRRDGRAVGCARVRIGSPKGVAPEPPGGWDRGSEALYSAWIEHLFDAPPEEALSFDTLQEVLTNPSAICSTITSGSARTTTAARSAHRPTAPTSRTCCAPTSAGSSAFRSAIDSAVGARRRRRRAATRSTVAPAGDGDPRGWFARVSRLVMDTVHSGSARTALADETTDFYPVALTRAALRPGSIYADPYGHTLMIVQWVPQTAERGGMLLAVDAQPDNSVARKRFWEGTFLFADDVAGAGPGFKAIRPLDRATGAAVAPLSNAALTDDSGFALSAEQAMLTPEEFYARLGRLINPDGPAPASRPTGKHWRRSSSSSRPASTPCRRGEDYVRDPPGHHGADARRRGHLRDHRPLGGLRDTIARPPPARSR